MMDKYKNRGFKLTPQRLAILAYLEGNTSHPSAEEIFGAVSERFPTMSFATVYNTLETLKAKGEVTELTCDPQKKRFDPNTAPHNHIICSQCRRIVDVQVDYKIELPRASRMGFEITGNHIEFYGVCPSCRKGAPDARVPDRPKITESGGAS